MEKQLNIKTGDGHTIYGTHANSGTASDKLIIFVHGFIGHRNEHIHFNGAKFFTEKGFDTYRFELYCEEKGARHFRDTKISLHGKDITEVVRHFRDTYKKIYLVGHSFGGTSLLFTDSSLVDAFIFWDASYIEWKEEQKDFIFNEKIDAYIIDWGVEHIVGKGFVEELKNFPDCCELVAGIHKPVKFITAGSKGNLKAGKKYLERANEPKEHFNIDGADHNFNSFNAEEKLFEETYKWVTKF